MLHRWHQEEITLIAPALLAFEVTAGLRRLVYLQENTSEEGDDTFAHFRRIPIRLSQRRSLFPLTWQLAKRFNRPRAYDTAH